MLFRWASAYYVEASLPFGEVVCHAIGISLMSRKKWEKRLGWCCRGGLQSDLLRETQTHLNKTDYHPSLQHHSFAVCPLLF